MEPPVEDFTSLDPSSLNDHLSLLKMQWDSLRELNEHCSAVLLVSNEC